MLSMSIPNANPLIHSFFDDTGQDFDSRKMGVISTTLVSTYCHQILSPVQSCGLRYLSGKCTSISLANLLLALSTGHLLTA